MIKDNLKQIIKRQKDSLKLPLNNVERELIEKILKSFDDERVLVLTGLRRVGKSTLLKQIMLNQKNFAYVNFEDEIFLDFDVRDFELLNEILHDVYGKIDLYFFDEIQNIDKFELFVRKLQDLGKKIVITGSNASLLSKEFGTKLTGRYKQFILFPFSFTEFAKYYQFEINKSKLYKLEYKALVKKQFNNFFQKGGIPDYLQTNDDDYVKIVYDNIIYRDIISRYDIKKQKSFKELVHILSTNIASYQTYNSLKKTLKLSNSITVKEYISYLCNSFLFFEVPKFDYSLKKQLNAPKKIYLIDLIFKRIVGFNVSENKGRLLENLVFIELKRRGKEVYYFKEKSECDFVVKERNKITQAIQVCYELNDKNKEREISNLSEAMHFHKLKKGLVLTYDQEKMIKKDGLHIELKPVWKWLLGN